MAVAYDATSESHTGITGSVAEGSFSWTHTPAGTPRGVLIFVMQDNSATNKVTSITYGGVTVPAVSGGFAADTVGEIRSCKAYFLGAGVGTGAKTVQVNRSNDTTILYAVAITVTATTDTEVNTPGIVLQQADTALSEQSVGDGATGVNSLRFGALASALGTPPPAGANSTVIAGIDYGTQIAEVVRENTAGQGSRPVGFSVGTSDDTAAVYLAVREVVSVPSGAGYSDIYSDIYTDIGITVSTPGQITFSGQTVTFVTPSLTTATVSTPGRITFTGQTVTLVTPPPPPVAAAVSYLIEVAFLVPLLGVPSGADWTDVSQYVRDFSTRRGRSHELGRMQAGEASLVLDNRDRRFDPTFSTGPYYPNVVPMRHVRIRAISGTTTYNLFRGFVEDWGQQWSGPNAAGMGDATCEAHLVDAFKVLNLYDLTAYEAEVLADEPQGYWRLDELSGVVAATSGTDAALTGTYTASTTPGAAGPLYGGATAITVADTGATLGAMDVNDFETMQRLPPYTLEAWFRADVVPSGFLFTTPSGGGGGGFELGFSASQVYMRLYNNQGEIVQNNVFSVDNTTWAANTYHHLAVTFDADGSVGLYKNGVQVHQTNAVRPGKQWAGFKIGYAFNGRLAHAAFYPVALSAGRIAAHYASNISRIVPQKVDAAIGAVLDAIGWSTGLRSITTSSHTVQAHLPDANALTELLLLAEDTDGGVLFAGADGFIRFRSADNLRSDTLPAATWGDTTAELRYSGLTLRYDDEDLWTEVRASAANLDDALASDPTAALTYGARTLETSGGVLGSQNELTDRATGYLTRYKAPALRPDTLLAVDSSTQPTRTAEMFASEIGRRVTVIRRPPGGGAAISLGSLVEGVSHSPVGVLTQCRTTLNLVPVLDQTPWILGDATYGVLDSTTDLGW